VLEVYFLLKFQFTILKGALKNRDDEGYFPHFGPFFFFIFYLLPSFIFTALYICFGSEDMVVLGLAGLCMCVHACMCMCVCVCVCVCARARVWVHTYARGHCQVVSLVALHSIYRSRLSSS